MNFELKTPADGRGNRTAVTLDGVDLGHACNIELLIPADGVVLLKIEFHSDEEGTLLLSGEGKNQRLLTRTVCYSGSFTVTGLVESIVEPSDGR
jgi:hypothetical protein